MAKISEGKLRALMAAVLQCEHYVKLFEPDDEPRKSEVEPQFERFNDGGADSIIVSDTFAYWLVSRWILAKRLIERDQEASG